MALALALALARRRGSALAAALRQAVALALDVALVRRRGSALARRLGLALAQALGSEAVLGRRPRLVPVYPRLEEASAAASGRARPPPAAAFKWGRKPRHKGAGAPMAKAAGAEQQAKMKKEVRCFRRGIDRPSASLGMSHVHILVHVVMCLVCVWSVGQRDIPSSTLIRPDPTRSSLNRKTYAA